MADLRTATKVGSNLRRAAASNAATGTNLVGSGIVLGLVAGASGPVGLATAGVAAMAANMVGFGYLKRASSQNARATVLDTLVRGQTQIGALYGRPAASPGKGADASGSLGIMREAAARTAGEMGQTSTMGAPASGVAPNPADMGDGATEAYTRMQNGRSVFVKGYATPAR